MKNPMLHKHPSALALGLIACLSGCLFDKETNRGPVVDNEVRTGVLYTSEGKPVANARVRVFNVNHVPDSSDPAFSTRTDEKGAYVLDSLSNGEYNILGELDGQLSYQDSVSISARTLEIPADTLDAPGSLSGRVGLQPGDDPRSVTVQVLGTNNFTNVDAAGRFTLGNLAAGRYSLRVLSTLSEYTPLYAGVRVRTGAADTLRDTLWIPFTGIPVVTGIKAVLDTVNGVARLSWNAAAFAAFRSYLVFRDTAGGLEFAKSSLNKNRLADSAYYDTLYSSPTDTLPRKWEYRVAVQSQNGTQGRLFHVAELSAIPPAHVKTRFGFRVLSVHGDTASIKDTVKVTAAFDNRIHASRRIAWLEKGKPDTLRSVAVDALSGADTLVWIAPGSEGPKVLIVQSTDAAGRIWRDSLRMNVVTDHPSADAGHDTAVGYETQFTLRGKATDKHGSIVKMEWMFGGSGKYNETKSGDTTITLPETRDSAYKWILKVTDDDGLAGFDTVNLDIRLFRKEGALLTALAQSKFLTLGTFPIDGKIMTFTAHEESTAFESYDTATQISTFINSNPHYASSVALVGTRFYLQCGRWNGGKYLMTYDLVAGKWETELNPSPLGTTAFSPSLIGFEGKLYAFLQAGFDDITEIFEYLPGSKSWVKRNSYGKGGAAKLCTGGGKIYAKQDNYSKDVYYGEYDPVANKWRFLANNPDERIRSAMIWVDGNITVLGGDVRGGVNDQGPATDIVKVYDIAANRWSTSSPICYKTYSAGAAWYGGRFYVVGGGARTPDRNLYPLDVIQVSKP